MAGTDSRARRKAEVWESGHWAVKKTVSRPAQCYLVLGRCLMSPVHGRDKSPREEAKRRIAWRVQARSRSARNGIQKTYECHGNGNAEFTGGGMVRMPNSSP